MYIVGEKASETNVDPETDEDKNIEMAIGQNEVEDTSCSFKGSFSYAMASIMCGCICG